jgi:hypothetical protein
VHWAPGPDGLGVFFALIAPVAVGLPRRFGCRTSGAAGVVVDMLRPERAPQGHLVGDLESTAQRQWRGQKVCGEHCSAQRLPQHAARPRVTAVKRTASDGKDLCLMLV